MRIYPRLLYKGDNTLLVNDEIEEFRAGSDGWDCGRTPEKIAVKEANGCGVLRESPVEPVIKKRRRRRTKAEMERDAT